MERSSCRGEGARASKHKVGQRKSKENTRGEAGWGLSGLQTVHHEQKHPPTPPIETHARTGERTTTQGVLYLTSAERLISTTHRAASTGCTITASATSVVAAVSVAIIALRWRTAAPIASSIASAAAFVAVLRRWRP